MYKTSNDLTMNSTNIYPWSPNENISENPFKIQEHPWIIKKYDNSEVEVSKFSKPNTPIRPPEIHLYYKTEIYPNSGNPSVWGPAFWFSLHNGALRYPINPSPLWKERMKNFILGIPVMVPCEKCSDHASAHIEANYYRIDEITSSRSKLFEFFWEFHNFVNQRLGKSEMSLENAYRIYSGKVALTKLSYK